MKPILVVALLLAPTLARADCLQWGQDTRSNKVCMMDDLVNRNPITPLISNGVTITAAPQPKCDEGETLVTFPGTSIPMCASSLKPAHK